MAPGTIGLSARQLAPDAVTCRAVHRLVNKVEAVVRLLKTSTAASRCHWESAGAVEAFPQRYGLGGDEVQLARSLISRKFGSK